VEEEYCWAITQQRDGHAAADQVPVCWNLDFSRIPFSILVYLTIIFHRLGVPQN